MWKGEIFLLDEGENLKGYVVNDEEAIFKVLKILSRVKSVGVRNPMNFI